MLEHSPYHLHFTVPGLCALKLLNKLMNLRLNAIQHQIVTFLFRFSVHRENLLPSWCLQHLIEPSKFLRIRFKVEELLVHYTSCTLVSLRIIFYLRGICVAIDDIFGLLVTKKLNEILYGFHEFFVGGISIIF